MVLSNFSRVCSMPNSCAPIGIKQGRWLPCHFGTSDYSCRNEFGQRHNKGGNVGAPAPSATPMGWWWCMTALCHLGFSWKRGCLLQQICAPFLLLSGALFKRCPSRGNLTREKMGTQSSQLLLLWEESRCDITMSRDTMTSLPWVPQLLSTPLDFEFCFNLEVNVGIFL